MVLQFMKGELMQDSKQKQRITLLLTGETIALLRHYADTKLCTSSISQAVRAMAKEYEQQQVQQKKDN